MEPMSQPGWYPDPSGSGQPRYWDGSAWAPLTDPATGSGTGRGNRSLYAVLVALVAVAVVVALVIFRPWSSNPFAAQEDTNSAKPTGSQWNEMEPTETPTSPQPTDGEGRPVACPYVDGPTLGPQGDWYVSGGMGFRAVPGWDDGGGWTIDFASERSGQVDEVADTWVSITAIGQISKEDFSSDPRTAAHQLSDCMSTSYYYRTLDHREPLEDEAFTTSDGVSGWLIRQNFWNIPDQPVTGDEIVVVVLDAGAEDTLTLFHTQAPIEDQDRKDQVAAALETLSRR